MNDRELEELLNKGKKESEGFFSHMDVSSARKVVLRNVALPSGEKQKFFRQKVRKAKAVPVAAKLCALAACLVLVAVGILGIINTNAHVKNTADIPITQQSVTLDDAGKNYLVSFFPVNQPNFQEPSLMSVLWKMENSGVSHMVYSSLFEMCDESYPVSIIGFPGTTGKMLLLSSGDSQNKYLHYRLVGLVDGDATTLWSQDYVPDGRLGIQDGVVVEQREPVPVKDAGKMPRPQISYIIPYKADAWGKLYLPVESLQLYIGDQILLVGEDAGKSLKTSTQKDLLKKVEAKDKDAKETGMQVYEAAEAGADTLALSRAGSDRYLSVNILKD
jgi:hypothetical protein